MSKPLIGGHPANNPDARITVVGQTASPHSSPAPNIKLHSSFTTLMNMTISARCYGSHVTPATSDHTLLVDPLLNSFMPCPAHLPVLLQDHLQQCLRHVSSTLTQQQLLLLLLG